LEFEWEERRGKRELEEDMMGREEG